MKKIAWIIYLSLLVFLGAWKVSGYTVDELGRAEIRTAQDIRDAITVFSGGATSETKPAITSVPKTFILKNNVYYAGNNNDYRLIGGTAENPSTLVVDGDGYTYTFGDGGDYSTFLPSGSYISITFKNMNVGNVDNSVEIPVGITNPEDVKMASDKNAPYITHNWYGMFFCSGRKGITITYENVNYVAARYGQMLYATGGDATSPNVVRFKGNNNIIYPNGASGAQELSEGISQYEVLSGTTNIVIRNNNSGANIIKPDDASSTNPIKLTVAEGATLNFSDNGSSGGFYAGESADTIWQIDGTLNMDFTGGKRGFMSGSNKSFQMTVGSTGTFLTKGGLNWNFINRTRSNNGSTITAEENSYIDWERNNGRLFSGSPVANKFFIYLNNPRFAAFRSSKNNSLFGDYRQYNNLKIVCSANMAAYAYSSTTPDESTDSTSDEGSDVIGQDGLILEKDLSAMVRAVDHETTMGADFRVANDLIPVKDENDKAVLSQFKDAKAIFFKKAGMWWAEKPGDMTWRYSLADVWHLAPTMNGSYFAPRNDPEPENNFMKFTIRDDGVSGNVNWQITASATPLVDKVHNFTMAPLKWVEQYGEMEGEVMELSEWSLSSNSEILSQGKYNTDKTVTYDAMHGVIPQLTVNMFAGEYKGRVDWTLTDSIE
ncbi:hypothetical protein SAMN02745116_00172 [Pilibacter termitis]|uniref:Uncharacterized protein n=1 Tax=Pilibacter termitis TaxID=263852 RepID=A0A1T4KBF5_9ENTE|nr:hypothetical protein [Pilibacter termitis]SJZ39770.1 hypothetical protein SAMN02745116_00172 [Pilibacter termitis]